MNIIYRVTSCAEYFAKYLGVFVQALYIQHIYNIFNYPIKWQDHAIIVYNVKKHIHTFNASHKHIASYSHIGIIMYDMTLATSAGRVLRKSNRRLYSNKYKNGERCFHFVRLLENMRRITETSYLQIFISVKFSQPPAVVTVMRNNNTNCSFHFNTYH